MLLGIIQQEIYTGIIKIRAHSCDSPLPYIWQHRTCPCIRLVVSIFLLMLRSLQEASRVNVHATEAEGTEHKHFCKLSAINSRAGSAISEMTPPQQCRLLIWSEKGKELDKAGNRGRLFAQCWGQTAPQKSSSKTNACLTQSRCSVSLLLLSGSPT